MIGHKARRRAHSHRGRSIAWRQGARFRRRNSCRPMRLRLVKLDVEVVPTRHPYTGFWDFVESTFSHNI